MCHQKIILVLLNKFQPVLLICHKSTLFQTVQMFCEYSVLQFYKCFSCNHLSLRNSLMFNLIPNVSVLLLVTVKKGSPGSGCYSHWASGGKNRNYVKEDICQTLDIFSLLWFLFRNGLCSCAEFRLLKGTTPLNFSHNLQS